MKKKALYRGVLNLKNKNLLARLAGVIVLDQAKKTWMTV